MRGPYEGFTEYLTNPADPIRDYWFAPELIEAMGTGDLSNWSREGALLICDTGTARMVWRLTGEQSKHRNPLLRAVWPD